jgi:hypothetical protein
VVQASLTSMLMYLDGSSTPASQQLLAGQAPGQLRTFSGNCNTAIRVVFLQAA